MWELRELVSPIPERRLCKIEKKSSGFFKKKVNFVFN